MPVTVEAVVLTRVIQRSGNFWFRNSRTNDFHSYGAPPVCKKTKSCSSSSCGTTKNYELFQIDLYRHSFFYEYDRASNRVIH